MAQKRMFTMKIVDSDAFLDLPLSSQCLYFHLNMRADDDGFINNPKMIMRTIGASEDDMKLLLVKKFILSFESGVIVIKHWRLQNAIRKDRYKETNYQDEKCLLLLDENGIYHMLATKWQPNDNQWLPQVRLGKDRLGKVNESKATTRTFKQPTLEELKEFIQENNLEVDAERWLNYYTSNGFMVGRTKMKDWKACVRNWSRNNYGTKQEHRSNEMEISDDEVKAFQERLRRKESADI